MYSRKGVDKHALPETITRSGLVQFFKTKVLMMCHRRFANATQVSLRKFNQ